MTLEQHIEEARKHLDGVAKSSRLGVAGSNGRHLMLKELRTARRCLRSVEIFMEMRSDPGNRLDNPYRWGR